MSSIINLNTFTLPAWMNLAGVFLLSMLVTWLSIPTIVKISKFKKLNASVNERTSHFNDTPNLGGVAVFTGITLSMVIFSFHENAEMMICLLGGMILIFFIGIKDDILVIDPKKKFAGQVLASLIVVWLGGVRITNLYQVFGTGSIEPVLSILFTVFLFLLLINGFNLIDGIDGLASGLGILITLFLGIWFIVTGQANPGIISLAACGALIAFFRFNIFGRDNKIFLGDSGSMITGLIIAFLTVQFIEGNLDASREFQLNSAPGLAYALLIVPLIDLLRVFILRLFNGKSPFKADRNHIHHILLSLGCSHLLATLILMGVTILFLGIAYLLKDLGVFLLMFILTALGLFILAIPWMVLKYRLNAGKPV
jgi:UDP-GlcNAc:undecaprenyl-phosphate/decaprenyl-phosphate GlcNAc-1-phosphate transferase